MRGNRVLITLRYHTLLGLFVLWCQLLWSAEPGILRVGFDIDDTVLFTARLFAAAPRDSNQAVDYAWINTHDRDYSLLIEPTVTLIQYFLAHGHEVYFITSRPPVTGEQLAGFLTEQLGIQVQVGQNLFFTPKETVDGKRFTTKHQVMKALDLDLFYGDADTDIIAALKAGVQPVRIIRTAASVAQYGANYFGNTNHPVPPAYPFTKEDLARFYQAGVGPFGEPLYPIRWTDPGDPSKK
jgi:acid phosphatase class B